MKKYFIGMLAIGMAVTVVAFAPQQKNKRVDPYLYYFSFDGNSVMDETDSTKYTLLPDGPGAGCAETGPLYCVINADKNGSNRPILVSGGSPAFVEISSKAVQ